MHASLELSWMMEESALCPGLGKEFSRSEISFLVMTSSSLFPQLLSKELKLSLISPHFVSPTDHQVVLLVILSEQIFPFLL